MRRRKSSCPNIEPRRTSATPNRSSMKLDLYIEDDELQTTPLRRNSPSPTSVYHDHHHHNNQNNNRRRSSTTNNIEDTAEEVLCLRLLSTRTRYRFGGLRVNLISPVFNMNKLFNVEFDQDSQISLIKSQQSSFDQQQQQHQQTPDMESFFRNNNDLQQPKSTREGRCATIVIEPESEEQKDEITRQLPLLTADLTLLEETSNPINSSNSKTNDNNNYVKNTNNDNNQHHQTARSLTRIPEPESNEQSSIRRYAKRHQSTSSINHNNQNNNNNDNIKFESVKVYTKVEPTDPNLINLDTKIDSFNYHYQPQQQTSPSKKKNQQKDKEKSSSSTTTTTTKKIKDMRRHTHFYCHIPTSLTLSSSTSSSCQK
ncbi:hypothetical protein DERP_005217 [Dermatophagoides pteronyssinus]|uniref:Uncharacterized protein n=1 Tax=Dermatophagoides pteronyssinus TaxID=6956 RepID=A0ABQ8JLZ7_DERPT|nr:hypothetical protein DERP_005217 [Dermatophagoides pteronyssinus]